jgi:hypothetical protein
MLLIIGLMIAVVSTYTEIKLVHGSAFIRRLYVQGMGGIEGVWFNTAGSFLLSYLIGILFGATGLTVLFGGIVSTGLSQAYFSAEGFCSDRGWTIAGWKASANRSLNQVRDTKNATVRVINDFRQPVADLGRLILIIMRVLTLPFIWLRALSNAYTKHRTTP